MDKEIIKYRQKHPRCRYCKYCEIIVPPIALPMDSYYKCILKDKKVPLHKGLFCKWFKIKIS